MAVAYVFGTDKVPGVIGMIRFYVLDDGFTRLDVDVKNLPLERHGFNIKNGETYLLPDLLPSDGRAKMSFYTKRIDVTDVIAKKVFIEGNNEIVASGTIRRIIPGKRSYLD